jgi:hypothetical protein
MKCGRCGSGRLDADLFCMDCNYDTVDTSERDLLILIGFVTLLMVVL